MLGLKIGAIAVAALALGACQSSGSGSGGATNSASTTGVRETAATAPADLQLACASAASQQLGLPADGTLPTASAATAGGFQVTLTSPRGNASCEIGADGTVRSVVRV